MYYFIHSFLSNIIDVYILDSYLFIKLKALSDFFFITYPATLPETQ